MGVLPITPFTIHTLKVVSLLESDYFGAVMPKKDYAKATQQIWITHEYFKNPDQKPPRILFTKQHDFRLPGDHSRRVSMEVAEDLYEVMVGIKRHPELLLAGCVSIPGFWEGEFERAYQRIRRSTLAEMNISEAAFDLEKEGYLKEFGLG